MGRQVELSEYAAMMRRCARAYGRRFAEEGDEPDLAELFALVEVVEESLVSAVAELRSRGASWASIGRTVGMTGEGARRRWGEERAA